MKSNITEAFLRALLGSFNVPLDSWGIGKAKSIPDLLEELREGECHIRIDANGVTRVTEIVKIHIIDPSCPARGNLLEWLQIFPDRRERERKQKPSEKMKGGELPEVALGRGLKEELDLEPDGWVAKVLSVVEESNESPSYPGLSSVYVIHHFGVELKPGSPALRDEFIVKEPDGGELHFRWEHLGQRKPS